MYNLTEDERDLLRSIVREIRDAHIPEEFWLFWDAEGNPLLHWPGAGEFRSFAGITKGRLDSLLSENLIRCQIDYNVSHSTFGSSTREHRFEQSRSVRITAEGYKAVDANFEALDTSFVQHLTPLADISHFDAELQARSFPILRAGPADPKVWDSAVRTAGVILEDRLREIGRIHDHAVGRDLVNRVFGKTGTLAKEFTVDSEREGWRDLFAGVVGAFRNPSAHRLIDPNPEEGGAFIVFVNLLLSHLDKFAKPSPTTAEAFRRECPLNVASFFGEILDEAARQNLYVKFGSKGFSIRASGMPCFFYCYPPGAIGRSDATIEIYLKDIASSDPGKNTKMRVNFLENVDTIASGQYTIRMRVLEKNLADARNLWQQCLSYMAPSA